MSLKFFNFSTGLENLGSLIFPKIEMLYVEFCLQNVDVENILHTF